MKKLYFIDNYEKNRILSLHESATKKQYLQKNYLLSEQTMSLRQPLISKIKKFCNASQGKPATDTKTLDELSKKLISNKRTAGSMNINNIFHKINYDAIKSLKNVDDYCYVAKKCKESGYFEKSLTDWIMTFTQNDDLWEKNIKAPMEKLFGNIEKAEIQRKDEAYILNLAKQHFIEQGYPCIGNSNSPGLKGINRGDGTFEISDANYTYYSNGRRMMKSNTQMEDYHCEGNNVVQGPAEQLGQFNPSYDSETSTETSNTSTQSSSPDANTQSSSPDANPQQSKTNTQPRVAPGMGYVTKGYQQQFKSLLQSLGLGTEITQDAINKLYDKL